MEERESQVREVMILIAIGSNLSSELYGTPLDNCWSAIDFLKKKFKILSISNFYETEPIPESSQPWYVNGVVCIRTDNPPHEILKELLSIEKKFRRTRNIKNEPRVIDLDLLCYNNITINTLDLILPHPRMHLRKFVMQPICDINANWIHPKFNKKAKTLTKKLANQKIFNIKM
ncbi:MAG: 2-amino-4-hydroxy-6-hydroxymethyldihydropteridine diphosphokinase [Pseudomonadota bacterium]|nr:2-amino-4-hydroxy-6-hydroxymethyldihydropteridine diphosphokinase [Pseudomonadota bacterium]